jgi:hypothetical protein
VQTATTRIVSILWIAGLTLLMVPGRSRGAGPTSRPADFKVFDNLHAEGKPDLTAAGLLGCNIVYDGYVWPGGEKSASFGRMPDETAYKTAVRSHTTRPGPVVLDVETLALSGKPDVVAAHFQLFNTLARWTHEAVPGHVVGYYGHGLFPEEPGKEYAAQAQHLAGAVDAFFPSMYTFDANRDGWKRKADRLLKQARQLAPGKPVYYYLWPQFHGGTHAVLPVDQWSFELETARDLGADGVVLWSGSAAPPWDPNAAWWKATVVFVKQR